MSSGTTTVGSVKYDASIDLPSLRKSAAEADKIVKKSYENQAKAAKSAGKTPSSSGSALSAAQERIDAVKKEAVATAQAISSYTPKIQAQYFAVERANLRVESATRRTSDMIQKYGVDSIQAQNASDSLTRAIFSQSQAQQRLDQSTEKSTKAIGGMRVGTIAATAALAAATATIAANIGNAVHRFDTLNSAPKVLRNLGNTAEDSNGAITALKDGIQGLPTSLDSATGALTKISAASGLGAKSSAALTLAFNNMALAGGRGAAEAERALIQFTQALGKGKLPAQEFNTLMDVMPAQIQQVAKTMLGASANAYTLRDAMADGKVNMGDFSAAILKLNSEGGEGFASFERQAKDATAGIGTGFINMGTSVTRGINKIMDAIGGSNIQATIESIGKTFENVFNGIAYVIRATAAGFSPLSRTVSTATSSVSAFLGYVSPLAYLLAPIAGLLGGTALAFGAIAASVFIATKAMQAFQFMLTMITKHPIIATLSLIAGLITAIATSVGMGKLTKGLDSSADSSLDINKAMEDAMKNIGGSADNAADLSKQMKKIAEQAEKIRDDYRYSLAELVADKNENIAKLTDTLKSEKTAYDNAYKERLTSFNKTQNDELLSHQKKTAALQNQINFLSKYNTEANKKQLSELQFALARENAEHQKSAQLRKEEFDAETQSQFEEYEKRRLANQAQLDADLALLTKHKDEVAGVRGIMLRDQIQNLQYQRDEQLKSLNEQRQQALNSASSQAAGISKINQDALDKLRVDSSKAGEDMGKAIVDGVIKGIKDLPKRLWEAAKPGGAIDNMFNSWFGKDSALGKGFRHLVGFSDGGFTGRGGKHEAAGIVHAGEYVLPKDQVNQATGQPDWSKIGVGGGTNVTVNLSLSGVMTSSKADERAIATRIGKLINEAVKSKTGKTAIAGI